MWLCDYCCLMELLLWGFIGIAELLGVYVLLVFGLGV